MGTLGQCRRTLPPVTVAPLLGPQPPCGEPIKPGCSIKIKDFINSGCRKESCKVRGGLGCAAGGAGRRRARLPWLV